MIPWLVTAAVVLLSALLVAAYRRKAQRLLAELEEEHTVEMRLLEDEADARTRRLKRESETKQTHSRDALVADLLPIFDSLGMALDHAKDPDIVRGIELVQNDLLTALAKHGIESIEPEIGESFDPELHEAAEIVDETALQPGSIARPLRIGLRTEDRVLRSALVTVVKSADPTNGRREMEASAPEVDVTPATETGSGEVRN